MTPPAAGPLPAPPAGATTPATGPAPAGAPPPAGPPTPALASAVAASKASLTARARARVAAPPCPDVLLAPHTVALRVPHAPAQCTSSIDLVGTADVVTPARNPLVTALPYSCSFEEAFVVKPALSVSQSSRFAGRRSTALTCATTCAETEHKKNQRHPLARRDRCGRHSKHGTKSKLRFIATQNQLYQSSFYLLTRVPFRT